MLISVRTTVALEPDVLAALKDMARAERLTLGQAIAKLVRRATEERRETPEGFPLLPNRRSGAVVTTEHVKALQDDED